MHTPFFTSPNAHTPLRPHTHTPSWLLDLPASYIYNTVLYIKTILISKLTMDYFSSPITEFLIYLKHKIVTYESMLHM